MNNNLANLKKKTFLLNTKKLQHFKIFTGPSVSGWWSNGWWALAFRTKCTQYSI